MTSFDVLDAEMERLKAMSGGGSSLEPILSCTQHVHVDILTVREISLRDRE